MLFMAIGIVIGFSQFVMAEPAEVAKEEGGCTLNITDEMGNNFTFDLDMQKVITNSKTGVAKRTCIGMVPEAFFLPSYAVQFGEGYSCVDNVGAGYAGTLKGVYTPSGQISYKCSWGPETE